MHEMHLTTADLSKLMRNFGDTRDYSTIMRSIQRMLSGEVKVSGEMMVILHMLLAQHLRLKQHYPNVMWEKTPDGRHLTEVAGYRITLVPERNKWKIVCIPPGDQHALTFGRSAASLTEAKDRCLSYMETAEGQAASMAWL
ncbi:hypothetical protein AA12717_3082 [Gluconacetobacter sacchari DSM 12717]|nr:hypothetical protein AA12717_3082 [Gluconacetobacter sacchari DSM 12717]